ncbi:MAG: purine-nucleoside phosphorylase [candidate division Zixibacteria bacterium HGW-Zixibacteria-1]|nr:MAG: purine-nucleoside phosphorylase [candidate division Zixibacteria bacterium HGW-Zixibacteria-1]
MDNLREMISEAAAFIRTKVDIIPQIGIILGTGLGSLADGIEIAATVNYQDIPHFPVSTVESHAGRLLFGHLRNKPVVAMQGRFHYYEGYSLKQVTFPVRVMKELGIETLIVSNACGGLNPQFNRGDIMIITDHINLLGNNPLIGPNDDSIGDRFPDMYNCYDKDLVKLAENIALEQKLPVRKGVYVAVAGPNLETAAEYRFLRILAADVVGMSTVPEVIAARHQHTKVLAFSIITDMGLPDALGPCSLDEIIATANSAEPKLRELIAGCVEKM